MTNPSKTFKARSAVFAILATLPLAAHANNGNHYGWCQTSNPHYDAVLCGGSVGSSFGGATATATGTGSTGSALVAPVVTTQKIVVQPIAPKQFTGFGPVATVTSSKAPDITGYSPGYIVRPLPQQSFVGVSPSPVQQIPAPSFSGYSPAIQVTPLVAPSFTGFSPTVTLSPTPTPSFVGYSPVVVVHPQATPSITGYAPVLTVVPVESPSFTGYSPIVTVHPVTAPTVTGFAPVQTVSSVATPPLVGYGPTNLVPPTPSDLHSVNVTLAPVSVQRPRPKPANLKTVGATGTITHSEKSQGSVNTGQITSTAGRQDTAERHTVSDDSGAVWSCLSSGHGPRTVETDNGANVAVLRSATRVDTLARNIPARHPRQSHCLVSIQRDRK
ncbi:hypothetical protein QQG91_12290 [Marivivens sp. LCG002]|uniref:hypothetical protein n=1 Tax=Marivivens sp. LCG002 TaxID=3051171 RepID=UPI0025573632|nr:hypothetical protein [Marivivens sp. LCG002]WIV50440.1 hypothetical protein QQG91_12290 [Marivivens sp. LCG002]